MLLRSRLATLALVLLVVAGSAGAEEPGPAGNGEPLADRHRQFLADVQWILSADERETFLALTRDYQRDAFVERFWKVRDPYPRTARNEAREEHESRLAAMRSELGEAVADARAESYMRHGPPAERIVPRCNASMWRTEVWYYAGSDLLRYEFILLFYRRGGLPAYTLWNPLDGVEELWQDRVAARQGFGGACDFEGGTALAKAVGFWGREGEMAAMSFFAKVEKRPPPPHPEWVATFGAASTDLPDGAATFASRVEVEQGGRRGSRTLVRAAIRVPIEEVTASEVGSRRSFDLLVNGEVLREGRLHEGFRYRFGFPADEAAGEPEPELVLVVERALRPGEYRLILNVRDLGGERYSRNELDLTVPAEGEAPEAAVEEAAAPEVERPGLRLVPLLGEWQTGLVRTHAEVLDPAIERIVFSLDGRPVMAKSAPPWALELDLGSVPRTRRLRAVGLDAGGREVARDEVVLNGGRHRFAVRFVEPRPDGGRRYRGSVEVRVDLAVPAELVVDRLELFRGDDRVATLFAPPWIQALPLPAGDGPTADEPFALRALAVAKSGETAEATTLVNAGGMAEELDVDLVELTAAVVDRAGRPVEGLGAADFAVFEDGVRQELRQLEVVRDAPLRVAVLLDTSASMAAALDDARAAALGFFQRAIGPRDRAALVTFDDHAELRSAFTASQSDLAAGLAGLVAERGTALWDALVFALYDFNGLHGPKALVVLSDGRDESSRYRLADAVQFAQRSGVAVYAIGLGLGVGSAGRGELRRLADETGGLSFFPSASAELAEVYRTIERDLRSRYLLAYQSTHPGGDAFRTVEVEVARRGVEARTLRGYYP